MADYDIVSEDGAESSRIPMHSEEAFQLGIQYKAKFIGFMEVPRPQSRSEIVSVMRRIRFEYKAKAVKKRKVMLSISVDGVTVVARNARRKSLWWDSSSKLLHHHPIYRIFYVSHDSQDLKIFSYIARDGQRNTFRCIVFKAYKKTQAMRIVRTIGQAFEVCHQMSSTSKDKASCSDVVVSPVQTPSTALQTESAKTVSNSKPTSPIKSASMDVIKTKSSDGKTPDVVSSAVHQSPSMNNLTSSTSEPRCLNLPSMDYSSQSIGTITSPMVSLPSSWENENAKSNYSIASYHQGQLLRQQLEQQAQHTHIAISQVHLLKDQLAAETAARIESQARVHQLLVQNRDLIDHLNQLVHKIYSMEDQVVSGHFTLPKSRTHNSLARTTATSSTECLDPKTKSSLLLYHSNYKDLLPDRVTPKCESPGLKMMLSSCQEMTAPHLSTLDEHVFSSSTSIQDAGAATSSMEVQVSKSDTNKASSTPAFSQSGSQNNSHNSPDSGHKEMSADSLSQALTFLDAYPTERKKSLDYSISQESSKSSNTSTGTSIQRRSHKAPDSFSVFCSTANYSIKDPTTVRRELLVNNVSASVDSSTAHYPLQHTHSLPVSKSHNGALSCSSSSSSSNKENATPENVKFVPPATWLVSFRDSPSSLRRKQDDCTTSIVARSTSNSDTKSVCNGPLKKMVPDNSGLTRSASLNYNNSSSSDGGNSGTNSAHLNHSFEWHTEVALAEMETLDED